MKCIVASIQIYRFLAGGPFFERYAANAYRISRSTSNNILNQTCNAIIDVLSKSEFMAYNRQNWSTIAAEFEEKWHFPNCLGALDGKHIQIQRPPNAGSEYFNYKVIHISFQYILIKYLIYSCVPLFFYFQALSQHHLDGCV